MTDFRDRIIETLRNWGEGMDYPEALFELLCPMFANHFCVADAARASAVTLQVAAECVAADGYTSSRIVERLREEGLAVTMSDLHPHALNFANAVCDMQEVARDGYVEWYGSQLDDGPTRRRVHVGVGESEMSSSHAVQWAKDVLNAMVSGLSAGRIGRRVRGIPCPHCGSVANLRFRGSTLLGCDSCIKGTCGRCGFAQCSCLGGPRVERAPSELDRKRVGQ